ncbi:MAG: dienelactone hydrolase family protein [Caulobacteraceae bacterium]|nr:MAG: dienelactone hydrolase family protein [Caulobacteraceae bacterium]
MCDDEINQGLVIDPTVNRRTFGLMTGAAAGLGAGAVAFDAYAANVVEKDVTVTTPDGTSDAALYYPEGKGTWPAVLMWPDVMSLRPVFREMGRRLAAEGYVVLVPNLYYRVQKAPVVGDTFNFQNPTDAAKLAPMRASVTDPGTDKDAVAYLAFLDAQPQTNKKAKAGVEGYCMGGPLSFRTAAAVPGRIGAVVTFHGGGLATANPNSPHLLVAKTKAEYLCAVAKNDDTRDPKAKDTLNEAFDAAKLKHHVEVYQADHGWTVRGSAVYNQAEAERAYAEHTKVYKRALV